MRQALRHALFVIGIALITVSHSSLASSSVAVNHNKSLGTAGSHQSSVGFGEQAHIVSISPGEHETVGVASPVTLHFSHAVVHREELERSVQFVAPAVPRGSFSWPDAATLQWTPTEYWPAHSTIALTLAHVHHTFRTGAQVLGIASLSAHTFTVKIDGTVVKVMPASMGKPRHTTPIGTFTTLEKQSPVIMDSRTIGIPLNSPEGYRLTVYYAVRVTWGGVYVHSAPWSTASQGKANVSHGCVNLSPDNAAWYYKTVSIGDPVIVQA